MKILQMSRSVSLTCYNCYWDFCPSFQLLTFGIFISPLSFRCFLLFCQLIGQPDNWQTHLWHLAMVLSSKQSSLWERWNFIGSCRILVYYLRHSVPCSPISRIFLFLLLIPTPTLPQFWWCTLLSVCSLGARFGG